MVQVVRSNPGQSPQLGDGTCRCRSEPIDGHYRSGGSRRALSLLGGSVLRSSRIDHECRSGDDDVQLLVQRTVTVEAHFAGDTDLLPYEELVADIDLERTGSNCPNTRRWSPAPWITNATLPGTTVQ